MSKPKLVLIDGHSLAYRAFFALPPDLKTRSGELTNAVYGFVSMLLAVWRDEKPDLMLTYLPHLDYSGHRAGPQSDGHRAAARRSQSREVTAPSPRRATSGYARV